MIELTVEEKLMKWLEIIELRATNLNKKLINQKIKSLFQEFKNEYKIQIYINAQVETDLSIHIHHYSDEVETNNSELGRRLKEMLKEFGLVNLSIWVKQKSNTKISEY